VHKYTPLVCRDPYAKPSKRKLRDKFEDMFISDAVKLPVITKLKAEESVVKKMAPKRKEMEPSNEPQIPKANTRTRGSEKFQVGNTLHFKYSDFILRKMDRSTSSKDRIFIVK